MKNNLLLLLFAILVCCAGSVQAQHIYTDTVFILRTTQDAPVDARPLGKIKARSVDATPNYELTMFFLKVRAKAKGANMLKLTRLKRPGWINTGYRVRAEMYHIDSTAAYVAYRKRVVDSAMGALLPDANASLLYVYRPRSVAGIAVPYPVYVNDTLKCGVGTGSSRVVRLHETGRTVVSAKTETIDEVVLDVKPGKIYFIRCSVAMGQFVGRPQLQLVDDYDGLMEFFDPQAVNPPSYK